MLAAIASLALASPVTLHTPFDPVIAGEGQVVAQIAVDADFEFFQLNGMSVDATVEAIEEVLDAAAGAFANGPGVIFEVTAIVVRTDPNDPYTSSDPNVLLQQVRNEWIANQDVQWDAVQLFTGRNLNGAVVAVTAPSSICTPNAVAVVAGVGMQDIARQHLSTRTFGLIFGATSCFIEPDCGVMCPSAFTCGGDPLVFREDAVAQIQALIDTQGDCLEPVSGCAADCNGDGELTILDFVCFQGLFSAGDPNADCDANGALDVLDFVCFQTAFQAGCD